MVFVPLSREDAVLLRRESVPPRTGKSGWLGHAATDALMATHEYDPATAEDADFAALCYAGVSALSRTPDPLRLILALDVAASEVTLNPPAGGVVPDPYGHVSLERIGWPSVTALFADEAAAAAAVAAARAAVAGGLSLEDALDLPAVATLLDDHDLLWFAPEELDQLPT